MREYGLLNYIIIIILCSMRFIIITQSDPKHSRGQTIIIHKYTLYCSDTLVLHPEVHAIRYRILPHNPIYYTKSVDFSRKYY